MTETRDSAVLVGQSLTKTFSVRTRSLMRSARETLTAVDAVDVTLRENEILGIVGESGCGKSTLGRMLAGMSAPSSGTRTFRGTDVTDVSSRTSKDVRPEIQMVFQDPYSSLNPRRTVGQSLVEPLVINRKATAREGKELAKAALAKVGLSARHFDSYPHQFSGGQRQRVGIARALILDPSVIIADEPVSALDMSVQAQVLNLLSDLRDEASFSMVLISHDIAVVRHMADRVGVMYLGQLIEYGNAEEVVANALHPYTQALISSIPSTTPNTLRERIILQGDLPSPLSPPSGCRFRTRCQFAMPICATETPQLRRITDGQTVACHLYDGQGVPEVSTSKAVS